jgi:hypothetical protein
LEVELGAVIMLGAGGDSAQEQMVLAAQRASAIDLITMLQAQGVARIVVAAPSTEWLPGAVRSGVICADDAPGQPFHFGARLAGLIEQYALEPALYFGGGSAPLLDVSAGDMLVSLLMRAGRQPASSIPSHIALTNNLHSSDWIGISHVGAALPTLRAQARDNGIAWTLREGGEYDVRVLSGIRPATSLDIDTPGDLAILAHHPDLQPALRAAIGGMCLDTIPVQPVLDICRQEGKTLALIGRVSPPAWQALNRATRIWTRVVAEERGMVASERVERGEVRSVLVPWLKARGLAGFFRDLADMADAALFDSRVLFAALGQHPDAADRFASDLLWPDEVRDPWLRDFTHAAREAPLPVILGGHSVVSGGLHALVEIIEGRARAAAT